MGAIGFPYACPKLGVGVEEEGPGQGRNGVRDKRDGDGYGRY